MARAGRTTHRSVCERLGWRRHSHIEIGQIVERDGFVFCDLSQAESTMASTGSVGMAFGAASAPGQMERPARKSR